MTSLLLFRNGNLQFLNTIIRRLSSYNNNRTRSGITSLIQNEDLNIWSEKYWSELGKQFNRSQDFPLPGQIGTVLEIPKNQNNTNNSADSALIINQVCENLNYLFNKPLPQENQINKIKEAVGGFYYQDKMDNMFFSSENSNESIPCFELNAYACPKSLILDFQTYFRLNSLNESQLSVITVSFKTENDMATWNAEVDSEREILTQKYVETAQKICLSLEKAGYWADFIDPSSGRPYKAPYSYATFYETDERYRHLGFEIEDHGCCKVVSHHKWGTKTYVGCLLTNADLNSKIVRELTQQ